ncbi:MAG: aquaporin Z [Myxococcales bacterium]|nr:aquaporin Z [Myxococcales bacterium]
MRAALAECLGTFWLVLGGCGAAVFAAGFGAETNNNLGLGFLGVSLAFGLSVVTGAYAFGHVSGGHFNPAVTAGLAVAGRFEPAKIPAYVVAQIVGGILAATVIFTIASGAQGFAIDGSAAGAFATNGYGALSPGGYSMVSALLAEIVLTAVFLIVILGATSKGSAAGMGGLAIGLCLTLIHMVSIPITNTSVNPARSTAMAVFVGGDQVGQLWLFWVAPLVGAALGGGIHRFFLDADDS